jgi:hypothetical protein
MIGAIAILVIAYWFYRTAEHCRLPTLPWVIAGVAVYYICFAIWMYGVLKPTLGSQFKAHGLWLGLGMDISAVLIGALAAALLRSRVLLRQGKPPFQAPF